VFREAVVRRSRLVTRSQDLHTEIPLPPGHLDLKPGEIWLGSQPFQRGNCAYFEELAKKFNIPPTQDHIILTWTWNTVTQKLRYVHVTPSGLGFDSQGETLASIHSRISEPFDAFEISAIKVLHLAGLVDFVPGALEKTDAEWMQIPALLDGEHWPSVVAPRPTSN